MGSEKVSSTVKLSSREMILRTASRLFQKQGYHGTGLNQIIKESGSPKGSLYYYFPKGKEELAIEAIHHIKDFVMKITQQAMAKFDDPVEAIQQHIRDTALQFHNPDNFQGLPLGLMASETSLLSETLREACKSAFDDWQSVYAQKLLQCGYSKEKAAELSVLINMMVEGGIILSLANQNSQALLLIVDQIPILLEKKS